MTSTIDHPPTDTPDRVELLENQNTTLWITLVVVAAIALALGGIVISNATTNDATMPAGVEQAVADFFDASNEADYQAFLEATTGDFTRPEYWTRDNDTTAPVREVATLADMEDNFRSGAIYEITNVGEPLVYGDGPWFVSQAQIWQVRANDYTPGDEHYEAVYTLTVVDDNGTFKVDNAYWAGFGPIKAED